MTPLKPRLEQLVSDWVVDPNGNMVITDSTDNCRTAIDAATLLLDMFDDLMTITQCADSNDPAMSDPLRRIHNTLKGMPTP